MKKPVNNTNTTATIFNYEILRVKLNKFNVVNFSMKINDITINNCKVIEGKNGDFISFPSYKGSDGKYYNHVYIKLSDSDLKDILKAVEEKLNG